MARMIPEHFDETTASTAERLLYYHLQNHLEDDWTVIHSLPWLDDSRPRLQQGECDFLLLHARHGMLVMEAKAGTPAYDGPADQWHYDDGSRLTDPVPPGPPRHAFPARSAREPVVRLASGGAALRLRGGVSGRPRGARHAAPGHEPRTPAAGT